MQIDKALWKYERTNYKQAITTCQEIITVFWDNYENALNKNRSVVPVKEELLFMLFLTSEAEIKKFKSVVSKEILRRSMFKIEYLQKKALMATTQGRIAFLQLNKNVPNASVIPPINIVLGVDSTSVTKDIEKLIK